ncbi:MAG: efflux RND transporter periplasmic adaptor subunit, partial [Deltaproteobacteria bacterium]|nr:efflux RND transporter periplasmic adaptor subunit [Deltaproteobacteria bacterium]
MQTMCSSLSFSRYLLIISLVLFILEHGALSDDSEKKQGPPPVPVRVAAVQKQMVSQQLSLVGTAEAIATSTVAAEVSGVDEYFLAKEGDFVKKGEHLVRLRSTGLKIRLKGAKAAKEKIKANL